MNQFSIRGLGLALASLTLFGASSCALEAGNDDVDEVVEPVVFGSDNRRNYYEATTAQQTRMNSVAAVVEDANIITWPDGVDRLATRALTELCTDQKFWGEDMLSAASAFYIGQGLMVTAAHVNPCEELSPGVMKHAIVFRYQVEDASQLLPFGNLIYTSVLPDDRFYCDELIYEHTTFDVAVFSVNDPSRLDTSGRTPLVLKQRYEELLNATVSATGHDNGLAQKYSTGGTVVFDLSGSFFRTTLDIGKGDSGGPVFDASGNVLGLVSRGPTANLTEDTVNHCYDWTPCSVATGCDPGGVVPYPEITHVNQIVEHIPGYATATCSTQPVASAEYCSSTCLCSYGEGDCDGASECLGTLRCATDFGPAFGMGPTYEVCVTAGCETRTMKSDSFCSAGCPCGHGGGDCEENKIECMPGHTCDSDVGPAYGMKPATDVCVPTGCETRTMRTSSYCTSACPCGHGGGDCDDGQCLPDLKCVDNIGPAFGMGSTYEVCVPKGCTQQTEANLGKAGFCTTACPCGEGGGDCNVATDCFPGLVCTQNVGAQYGYGSSVDICQRP